MKTSTLSFKKTIALLICAVMILAQIQIAAFSSAPAFADETTPTTKANKASGFVDKSETCRWEVDEDYKMRIFAANGTSCVLNGPNNEFIKAFSATVNDEPIRKYVKEVVIEPTVTFGEDISFLFSDFEQLTTINTDAWNVQAVKNMGHLFQNCKSLETINVSSWNTSNVTNMECMFSTCPSLKLVDVNQWDTSNVTSMAKMFDGCQSLQSIDLSNWNTSNVKSMDRIFSDCYSLKVMKVGQFVRFVVGSDDEVVFPDDGANYWYSPSAKKYFTSKEITDNRSGIGDLYIIVNKMATHVTIEGATVPKAGDPVRTENLKITAQTGSEVLSTQTAQATWTSGTVPNDKTYQPGKTYTLSVRAVLTNRNVFQEGCTVSAAGFSKILHNDSSLGSEPSLGTVERVYTLEYTIPGPSSDVPGSSDKDPLTTAETAAMHRLYNPNSGEHFYTANVPERDHLISVGWRYEGVGWYAPKSGSPVYRLYNPNAGDHHYTLSVAERDHLISVGWNFEGVGWNSGGNYVLHRLYNPNAIAGAHHYTLNTAERDMLIKEGWRYEGTCWNAVK